ncbi:hypothetical protein EVAR_24879_1 [Eumeta japonica]|uniref:Mos1 transposase HTH domain-containing protein n=1 Tax=Eumeta variegata TaxID=151549 RepID=A0A4C1V897_EUMVA|nr:hypothetical protein EVAR_24879_1 [Eumeta japonica]
MTASDKCTASVRRRARRPWAAATCSNLEEQTCIPAPESRWSPLPIDACNHRGVIGALSPLGRIRIFDGEGSGLMEGRVRALDNDKPKTDDAPLLLFIPLMLPYYSGNARGCIVYSSTQQLDRMMTGMKHAEGPRCPRSSRKRNRFAFLPIANGFILIKWPSLKRGCLCARRAPPELMSGLVRILVCHIEDGTFVQYPLPMLVCLRSRAPHRYVFSAKQYGVVKWSTISYGMSANNYLVHRRKRSERHETAEHPRGIPSDAGRGKGRLYLFVGQEALGGRRVFSLIDNSSLRLRAAPVTPAMLTQKLRIDQLTSTFGNKAPSKTTAYHWFSEFDRGRFMLTDEFEEGRLKSAKLEH